MRFAFVATLGAVLLSACGGGPESPNFDDQIVGIRIAPEPARVDIGSSAQLIAQGLYSTAPGTVGGVPCAGSPSLVCTIGPAPTTVTWTSEGGSSQPAITVDASGVVRGLRHGTGQVRATFRQITDDVQVFVGGEVLTAISITSTEPGGTTSVPLGREVSYSATGTYSTYDVCPGGGDSVCVVRTRTAPASVNWALANSAIGTPDPVQGSDTVVDSRVQGTTTVRATVTNVEGLELIDSEPFAVTPAVLEQILIAPDNQTIPVGTTKNFTVTGRFSNQDSFGDIPVSSVNIVWESSNPSAASVDAGPGTATVATGLSTGSSAPNSTATVTLTARAQNTAENASALLDEDGNPIIDTAMIVVTQADLIEVIQACPEATDGTGNAVCPASTADFFNLPASLNATTPESKRDLILLGRFTNSELPVPIANQFIDWTTPDGVTLATVDSLGTVTAGTMVGSVDVTGTIKPGTYPNATRRSDSIAVRVTDRICSIPFVAADGASASGSPTANVTEPENVVDADPNSAATITLESGFTSTTFRLSVNAGAGKSFAATGPRSGFVIERPQNGAFNPGDQDADGDLEINFFNGNQSRASTDLQVTRLSGSSASNRIRELISVTTPTGTPNTFDRMDLEFTVPAASLGLPIPIVDELLGFLLGGSTFEFDVYSACAQATPPP